MTEKGKVVAKHAANASLLGSAGLIGLSQLSDLPIDLGDFGEPVGLILGLIGAALKVWRFFAEKKEG
jgi:hypothetical protein